ncbi:MAG: AbrB/MazE/SpoVT family DNA-binding domain-containing protein [Candidatus Bathyarchaeia archaeon]
MGKTHADKIREAVTDLGIASPNEIMEWIKKHYPNDNLNPRSYRADIIGCSQNHSSSHHYPNMPKFLWFEENTKKYRLARPEEAATLRSLKEEAPSESTQLLLNEIPLSKMSVTGQIEIPAVIREKLGFKPGDLFAFVINKDVLEIRRAKIKIEIE